MTQNLQANSHQLGALVGANKKHNYFELHYSSGEIARFYLLKSGIFRYFLDFDNDFSRLDHGLISPAIDEEYFTNSQIRASSDSLIINAENYQIIFHHDPSTMSIFDTHSHRTLIKQKSPLKLSSLGTIETLIQRTNEFYFGAGLQLGHFNHRGEKVNIKFDGLTSHGGVLSQVPFFWSNAGFGEIRNTRKAGIYDFGKTNSDTVLSHQSRTFDNFYLLGNSTSEILQKFYFLTAKPQILPEYSLGLGALNNFITTMWEPCAAKERTATKFSEHNFYKQTSDATKATAKSSLNGQDMYQFSARRFLSRYRENGFPLSWIVPNYQVSLVNPRETTDFEDYAAKENVHTILWTKDKNPQQIIPQKPIIFSSLGGTWENLKTQITGLLSSSLSGQSIVGAAIDGSNGGNAQISLRDLEWKAFTPLFFNLEGQKYFSKTPFAYNNKIININQAYYELRKQLCNYFAGLNQEIQKGLPFLRPLFIAFPDNDINYSERFSSEFMVGNNLLIAPITNGREDEHNNSLKDNLYLPGSQTIWIDLFTGQKFLGGRVFNTLSYANWHLPVFVRAGAIFELAKDNYLIYPHQKSTTNIFTKATSKQQETITSFLTPQQLTLTLSKTNLDTEAETATKKINVMCDQHPGKITIRTPQKNINLPEYHQQIDFDQAPEGYFYNKNYQPFSAFKQFYTSKQTALQIKLRDHNFSSIKIEIDDFNYANNIMERAITDSLLQIPKIPTVDPSRITAHSFTLSWPANNDRVQIEMNGLLYEGIKGSTFTFHELKPNSRYIIRLRYVKGNKVSPWSEQFGVITKKSAMTYAIRDFSLTSNYADKTGNELNNLLDLRPATSWQSKTGINQQALELTFTFKKIEKLSRMVYLPQPLDHQGTPTQIEISVSKDGKDFIPYDNYTWKADNKNKVIGLRDLCAKAIKLTIKEALGDFAAANNIIFFRSKK